MIPPKNISLADHVSEIVKTKIKWSEWERQSRGACCQSTVRSWGDINNSVFCTENPEPSSACFFPHKIWLLSWAGCVFHGGRIMKIWRRRFIHDSHSRDF